MRKEVLLMNPVITKNLIKQGGKILVKVGEIVLPLISGYYAKKELDDMVSKKVAEEVSKAMQNK